MHPRFFDMVRHAVGRGLRITTNSNLTLLNARRAEQCMASGLHELHGSIDGATPATYEGIRQDLDSDDPPETCRSSALYRGTF